MKFKGIAFALIFISVPAFADPAARCPCFTDMQVAGTCAYAGTVEFADSDINDIRYTKVKCQNTLPYQRQDPSLEVWLFETLQYRNTGVRTCRAFRDVLKPSSGPYRQFSPGNIAEDNKLSVDEAVACAVALHSAACLLDDDNCED
jgi:hypothetical protein